MHINDIALIILALARPLSPIIQLYARSLSFTKHIVVYNCIMGLSCLVDVKIMKTDRSFIETAWDMLSRFAQPLIDGKSRNRANRAGIA